MTIQEIKKSAKINLQGNYLKCALVTLIYFIIVAVLTFLLNLIETNLENHTVILVIIQAIFGIVSSILSYGVIANVISLIKGETNSITKFIDISILNAPKYILTLLNVLLRILIPLIIILLCFFYLFGTIVAAISETNFLCFYSNLLPLAIILFIASAIVLFYFILKYTLVPFVYKSNSELSPKEIVERSNKLMKKQKLNYILLILSFVGWLLLTSIILLILGYFVESVYLTPIIILFYTLIRPYIIASELNFFEILNEIKEEEQIETH